MPPLAFDALAKALAEQCDSVTASEALSHPHWKISLESTSTPGQLAEEISQAWRKIRADQGHPHPSRPAEAGRRAFPRNPYDHQEP